MQGKVEICGINTSKLQTLSNAEMMRLIERSQQGDMEARSRLVEGNLKLVLSVVQRFLSRGENPDDLFQVGCIGLLKAIANFDTTKNVRFSTYGVPMIAGELRRYLRDYSPIRVSRSLRDTAYRVLQCRQPERPGTRPPQSKSRGPVHPSGGQFELTDFAADDTFINVITLFEISDCPSAFSFASPRPFSKRKRWQKKTSPEGFRFPSRPP